MIGEGYLSFWDENDDSLEVAQITDDMTLCIENSESAYYHEEIEYTSRLELAESEMLHDPDYE